MLAWIKSTFFRLVQSLWQKQNKIRPARKVVQENVSCTSAKAVFKPLESFFLSPLLRRFAALFKSSTTARRMFDTSYTVIAGQQHLAKPRAIKTAPSFLIFVAVDYENMTIECHTMWIIFLLDERWDRLRFVFYQVHCILQCGPQLLSGCVV